MRLHYYHACIATEVGDFKLSLHHFKHAHSCFNKVTSEGCTGPTQRELRNYIGGIANSLNGLGYNNEAEGYYLKSLKLGDPDDIESPYEVNLCRCRWAAGRFEEAGKRLCELIELREKVYKQKNDIRNYLYVSHFVCLCDRLSKQIQDGPHAVCPWECSHLPGST